MPAVQSGWLQAAPPPLLLPLDEPELLPLLLPLEDPELLPEELPLDDPELLPLDEPELLPLLLPPEEPELLPEELPPVAVPQSATFGVPIPVGPSYPAAIRN